MRSALWVGLAAAVLLTAGLAGCIGTDEASPETASDPGAASADGGDATAPDSGNGTADVNGTDGAGLGTLSDGSPVPTDLTFTGCSEQLGVFPVPAEAFGGSLPDGFSTVPFDPAGQTATLVAISLSCTREDGSEYRDVAGLLQVEPPEDLSRDDADFQYVLLGGVIADERSAEIYRAWGLGDDVDAGDVQIDVLADTPAARGGQVHAETEGFSLRMDSAVGGSPSGTEAGAARLFGVGNGTVSGVVDVDWTTSANGFQTGEAQLSISEATPVPQPIGEGLGLHFWGDEYTITFEHVDLAAGSGS